MFDSALLLVKFDLTFLVFKKTWIQAVETELQGTLSKFNL